MEHSSAHAGPAPAGTTYNINLQVSAAPHAGEAAQLSFVVTEQKVGDPLDQFEVLHDRLMHLIIVNDSLSYFAHVHPVLDRAAFEISHVFPEAGRYKLWAEAKPAGGEPVLAAFRLTVAGQAASPATEPTSVSGYQVRLTPSSRVPLHEPVELALRSQTRRVSRSPILNL